MEKNIIKQARLDISSFYKNHPKFKLNHSVSVITKLCKYAGSD